MEHILEILHNLWYGPDVVGLNYGLAPLAIAGIVKAGGSLLGGIFGGGKARRAERAALREKIRLRNKLNSLENNRQAIINPYADTKDLSSLAEDLSGQMSNPYANLGVATQAAEIQMEQTDIALANTLDTLMATGASAGGATALAQAALQSKKGVSANIEQQEAANEKMRARGEQMLQQQKQRSQTLTLAFAHPFSGIGLNMAKPVRFFVDQGGEEIDLNEPVKEELWTALSIL